MEKVAAARSVVIYFVPTSPIHAVVLVEDSTGRIHDVWDGHYDSMPDVWADIARRTGVDEWQTKTF